MVLATILEAPAAGQVAAAVSEEIAALVAEVLPSVVQVRRGRHGGAAGVIWRADGAIITNDHVVGDGRGPLEVILPDGRVLPGTVQARNRLLDLALVRVDATDLPAAAHGDSRDLRVGALVLAIGHPWGRRDVVTAGIVSGLGELRTPDGRTAGQYIRSDVGLAPGNSGGPLLNAAGCVVGINAMIFGGDLSVAIPSHAVSEWLASG